MQQQTDLYNSIVDRSVSLASYSSWEALRLHDVAADLGISLGDIYNCFADKEQISDAWFDRADRNMLRLTETPGFAHLNHQQQCRQLMMAWLAPLAIQQNVSRQMILSKLEPGHLHIQVPAMIRISRTVQWLREACQQKAKLPFRAIDETVMTGIYLCTFCCWLTDKTPGFRRTQQQLEKQLALAKRLRFLK